MEDIYLLISCLVLFFLATKFLRSRKQKKNLPPCPPSLPIIGHLHLLKKPAHRTFTNLSKKYGPIYSLRLGSRLAVIVSSPSIVKECLTKNDAVLANRPRNNAGKYLQYNFSTLGSADYGEHYRNLRRVCTVEIFSMSRMSNFSNIRKDEIKNLLRRIFIRTSINDVAQLELGPMFTDLTSNVILRMVAGKKYYGEEESDSEEARQFREMITEYFQYIGKRHIGDMFPILQGIDYDGFHKRMERVGKNADSFLQKLLDEHRLDKGRNTMINHLLTLQETQPEYYTDEIIKGLILIMLLGGTETSATSLEWAMSNLLNNPEVLRKAREEVDANIGHDHLMEEQDFSKLPYLQSIMKENLRLCPVAPLLAPHMPSEDCNIGGYDVPRGTMVFINAWTIQRDPSLWDDPTSFKPERYEGNKIEPYTYLPFGMGRRMCPGEDFSTRVVGLTLGSLIQCFDWDRIGQKEIDMSETTYITMKKVEPLLVLCKARPEVAEFLS